MVVATIKQKSKGISWNLSRKQNKYWLYILKLLDALLFFPEFALSREYARFKRANSDYSVPNLLLIQIIRVPYSSLAFSGSKIDDNDLIKTRGEDMLFIDLMHLLGSSMSEWRLVSIAVIACFRQFMFSAGMIMPDSRGFT